MHLHQRALVRRCQWQSSSISNFLHWQGRHYQLCLRSMFYNITFQRINKTMNVTARQPVFLTKILHQPWHCKLLSPLPLNFLNICFIKTEDQQAGCGWCLRLPYILLSISTSSHKNNSTVSTKRILKSRFIDIGRR